MLERKQSRAARRSPFILPEDTPDRPVSVVEDFNYGNPVCHPLEPRRDPRRNRDLAAFGAVRTKDTHLTARCKRLTARRGPLRALAVVEHSIITAIRHMPTDNAAYQELGGTHFTRRHPERATRRAITHPNQLAHTATPTAGKPQPDRQPQTPANPSAATGHPALPTPALTCCLFTRQQAANRPRACSALRRGRIDGLDGRHQLGVVLR
ncbi:hypothetical protein [Streptomyces sp. NPDC088748]|uniref:hypothetical protein n=1 Tax=Streptomyces sp. NPDC088748 TaxID=3365887 RepID=UPI003814493F